MDLSSFDCSAIPEWKEYPVGYKPFFAKADPKIWIDDRNVRLGSPYATKDNPNFGKRWPDGSPKWVSETYMQDRYESDMRTLLTRMEDDLYAGILTYLWLRSKFNYRTARGAKPMNFYANSGSDAFRRYYGAWMDARVGAEQGMVIPKNSVGLLGGYVRDLYGCDEFYLESNPTVTRPVRPFRNLRLCHWAAVADMDERMSLLKAADANPIFDVNRRMAYPRFLDWVYNQMMGINAEHGNKYAMVLGRNGLLGSVVRADGMGTYNQEWIEGGGDEKLNENQDGKRIEGADIVPIGADGQRVEEAERAGAAPAGQGVVGGHHRRGGTSETDRP